MNLMLMESVYCRIFGRSVLMVERLSFCVVKVAIPQSIYLFPGTPVEGRTRHSETLEAESLEALLQLRTSNSTHHRSPCHSACEMSKLSRESNATGGPRALREG